VSLKSFQDIVDLFFIQPTYRPVITQSRRETHGPQILRAGHQREVVTAMMGYPGPYLLTYDLVGFRPGCLEGVKGVTENWLDHSTSQMLWLGVQTEVETIIHGRFFPFISLARAIRIGFLRRRTSQWR
jgi:hypothetical protein